MKKEHTSQIEKIASLCKQRGFVFQSSEIYGGLSGVWDLGPYGHALTENIKKHWRNTFVHQHPNIYEISASILMSEKVWEASGHTESFTDPLVEDLETKKRYRADHILEDAGIDAEGMSIDEIAEAIEKNNILSPDGNKFGKPKVFNLLVETELGAVEGSKDKAYLRGEITQGVHVNFKNILDSMRPKIPFGIAQIGKAFRNEIVPGNFLFRVREFEQMELQFYVEPEEKSANKWFEHWKEESMKWYQSLGIRKENLRFRQHEDNERAHYAKDAWDIEYNIDGDWKEAWGIHHRGDWDLRRHEEYSKTAMQCLNPDGTKEMPWIIETSGGLGRAMLFVLLDAYREETIDDGERVYLALDPKIAPVKAAVFPLLKNKPELVEKAKQVFDDLRAIVPEIAFDDNGNVGKRYRRQDEIGTPLCITIDFDTLEDDTVTVRDRDSAEQTRVPISELGEMVRKNCA